MSLVLDRAYNFHWVTPDVARSAQPYLGLYGAYLKSHSFRSIINLRGANPGHGWWRRETRMAERLGIRHFDVRLSSRALPARATLIALADALEQAPRPVLLKCSGGQDRASLASALYLLLAAGPGARKDAEAQCALWPYLHMPQRHQRWIARFPAFACETVGGGRVAEWIRNGYTPEQFAAWLTAHGEGASFRAIQIAW